MKELEQLLDNYWIRKNKDKDLFYRVKDSIPEYKAFLSEKLGYHVIINPNLIKLEKLPGKAETWMGIHDFDSPLEYAFLCLLLTFLEDKGQEEQFVLSQVTDFIQSTLPGEEKADWTLFSHRRSLVKVMRFASDIGIIAVDDGDSQSFNGDSSSEVLYESTGLSRYFVRNFTMNILDVSSYRDIENEDYMDIDRDKGPLRRQRVYRRIFMSPVVYNNGPNDPDYAYIKNFRGLIESDVEKYLGGEFHVHRNGAMVMLPESNGLKDAFPENRAISDIALQMNLYIRESLKNGFLKQDKDDTIHLSKASFHTMVKELKESNMEGWSKEYRQMDQEKLCNELIKYMCSFLMLNTSEDGREIIIMPLAGKTVGKYPDDYNQASTEDSENE